jgi:hypothetical protein
MRAVPHQYRSVDDGGNVSGGALRQIRRTGRKVVPNLRKAQVDPLEIDHVQVGETALADHPAAGQAPCRRGHRGELPHRRLDRHRAALPDPVGERRSAR